MATIAGPILAVQAQKWLEKATERRKRKLDIFYVLMATRDARLSPEHVRALNQIDLEFSGARFLANVHLQTPKERRVTDAWKAYLENLGELANENNFASLNITRAERFLSLLLSLLEYFDFRFDRNTLRGSYSPMAHEQTQIEQDSIRTNLAAVLAGKQNLSIAIKPALP